MVQWLGLRGSTAGGTGSIPGWVTKILHAVWPKTKKDEKKLWGKDTFEMPEGGDVQESLAHTCLQLGIHHGP